MNDTASPDFMAALAAQLNATTAPPGTALPAMPPPPPPPPAYQGGPSIGFLAKMGSGLNVAPTGPATGDPFGLASGGPPPAPAPAPPPQAPPPTPVTPVDPSLMPTRGVDPNAVPMPAAPHGEAAPPDVQFRGLGGGVIPEHEANVRGPTQDAHLMASFDPQMQAAGNIDLRSNMQAAAEEAAYENQARSAMARQEAAEKVQLQRQAELEARQVDYENQVTQLGQAKLDDDRWWKKKGTGDKIGAIILSFIGGLTVMDPRGNGRNLAYEALMKEADDDVEAQKFDYMVQQDKAKNAHNAYALALEKFGSEDAAAGVARAANIDYSLAKLGQMQAQWKGTDASNYADDIRARLLAERERTIAAGIKFIPAQASPRRYQMMFRGQMAPGTFSEKEAQKEWIDHQVKPQETQDTQELGIAGQMSVERMKGRGAAEKDARERMLTLPNGDTIEARTGAEAQELSKLATSVHSANQLVDEAKQIRSDSSWVVSPTKTKRLKQIQAELTLSFKDRGGLGALSGPDMDLAARGTADLTGIGPGTDAALDSFAKTTSDALRNRVKAIPGAPGTAKGNAGAAKSLTFHGK